MCMLDNVRTKRDAVMEMAEANKISKVFVFGSRARKEERPDSDIDFLVDFKPGASLFDHVDMRDDHQDLFGVPVDVVSNRGLSPYIGPRIMAGGVPV